jgi:hypothetical protein
VRARFGVTGSYSHSYGCKNKKWERGLLVMGRIFHCILLADKLGSRVAF